MENNLDKISVASEGINFDAKHRYNPIVIARNFVITLIFVVFFVFATLNFVEKSEFEAARLTSSGISNQLKI